VAACQAAARRSGRRLVPVFRQRFAAARRAKNGDPPPLESYGVASWHQRSDPELVEGERRRARHHFSQTHVMPLPHLAEVLQKGKMEKRKTRKEMGCRPKGAAHDYGSRLSRALDEVGPQSDVRGVVTNDQ